MRKFVFILLTSTLVSCEQNTSNLDVSGLNQLPLLPKAPALAELYSSSCLSCHSSGLGGAPQAGDQQAWRPRLSQGMEILLDRTIGGYRGMPPLGSCGDCNEADFRALIEFMASATDSAKKSGE